MPIRVLALDVAARIAAGEVVERPASAVKELVENALDAGATAVTVEVQGGGLESILVSDNGEGIAWPDTEHLFQRHATSKLRSSEELEAITTLGFRGEALHSLAAVAWVSLLTRHRDEVQGTYVETRQGRALRREPRGAPVGTTVTVRHLFREVPARRKFLRSPQAELARVQSVISLYALTYPHARFTLRADGRNAFVSPGTGVLQDAAAAVYGASLAKPLLEVSYEAEEGLRVVGLISPPSLHRANRSYISLFVNSRPVQSRSLTFAVVEAYQGFLPVGRSPVAILSITLPPGDVDVNVHPAKAEVRFREERLVFSALQRAVRETLVSQSPVPQLDPQLLTAPGMARSATSPGTLGPLLMPDSRSAQGPLTPSRSKEEEPSALTWTPARALPALRVVGQVQETYIVAEGPDGMYLIDQHAAHECVLYERVMGAAARRDPQAQGLLEPVVVELSPPQIDVVQAQGELLERYGWQLESFGENSCLVRGMPSVLTSKGPLRSLVDLLDGLLAEEARGSWEEQVAATVACHGSVRAGMSLTVPEMVEMVHLLERAQEPHTCPHGRPTMVHLSASHLEREFRRR